MSTVKATIRDRESCAEKCAVTWNGEHGGSLPGGPFPGTDGGKGDVRRCEHGNVWLYVGSFENRFFCLMDKWRRVSKWWEPTLYRKAVRRLEAAEKGQVGAHLTDQEEG